MLPGRSRERVFCLRDIFLWRRHNWSTLTLVRLFIHKVLVAATFHFFLYWVCLIFPLHVFQPLKTAVILREILNISRSVSPNCISIYTITYACRCDVKIAQAFIRLLFYYITVGKITNACDDLHCSTKCKIAVNWPVSQSANHNEIIFSVM